MSSIRDFIPLSKLGEGTFSTVYKVRRLSDQKIYALKKVRLNNLNNKEKENALNQIRILASFQCETIVAYKEAFFDDKLNVLCIVMEFADGGDLQKFITAAKKDGRKTPEIVIWALMKDILAALAHLHTKGILHRDLKSANIFLHGSRFKLGDLNVSKVNGGSLAYTQTGTPYYASPEVWRDIPYDSKSDIWSFGCILYEIAAQCPPFGGQDMDELYRNVQKGTYRPIPSQYSIQLSEVISQCLEKNPNKRPSANQLLKHRIISHITGENQSLLVQNSVQNNQLLSTIKLPSDLKALKSNLPMSKYQENGKKVEEQNISNFLSDRVSSKQNLRAKLFAKSPNQKINNSQIFLSPRNVNKSNIYASCKSPEEILHKKLYSGPVYHSDKKIFQKHIQQPSNSKISNSSRLERRPESQIQQKSMLIEKYDKYMKEGVNRRPSGIPRTQKRPHNNESTSQHTNSNQQAVQDWKKKLVKKRRILSNNNYVQPFWMK